MWNNRKGLQNLPVEERAGCQECTWRYWCGGGCPLLTYRMTGRYDRKSPNCHIYQALFPDVLQLEALRLVRYTRPLDFEVTMEKKTEHPCVDRTQTYA
jgi:uncharacterized protein